MATTLVAAGISTPTRAGSPTSVNTPPTPRLGGFGDNWEPYSPAPRKSARLSSRNADNRTPSPHSSGRTSRPSHTHSQPPRPHSHPRAPASQPQSPKMTSPPATSPQKKRQPASASASASRIVSGSLTAESIRNAAAALNMEQPASATAARASLALPTPAKTPAHKHSEQKEKDVNAVARTLFGGATSTSGSSSRQQSPKKPRAKRTNEISLDSFEIHDEEADASIEIYTDSDARLPKVDVSEENPFYGEAGIAASTAPVRRSARNKNAAVEKVVEKTLQRDDGLLYVFRGKKVFRKFTDGEPSRSAVKPRLLFPTHKASKENEIFEDEEEAETDIEERAQPAPETPTVEAQKVDTPKAPRFAPASPPSTSRATRQSKKLTVSDEPTPIKAPVKGAKRGGRSPFDGWRRTKNSPSTSSSNSGQKRTGDPLASDPKRTKA